MARPRKEPVTEEATVETAKDETGETAIVVSKFDRFVDLIMDVEITRTPKSVTMHPWLQSQIDAGLVIKC